MLSIRTMPLLMKIAAKLDITPIVEKLKGVDIYNETQNDDGTVTREFDREKVGLLGFEVITELIPQLGKVADELPLLVAAYKNISIEDALDLDAIEVLKEIVADTGVMSFFKSALQKKVEPAL